MGRERHVKVGVTEPKGSAALEMGITAGLLEKKACSLNRTGSV